MIGSPSRPTEPGTLVEVNEHHTVIDFDEHGRRVFATRLVTLQATNEPAPAKAPRKRAARKPKEKEAKASEGGPRSALRVSPRAAARALDHAH